MPTMRVKKDDGQVALSVILLSLMILAAAVGVFLFGESADSRGKAQKSADAAALAAARDVRDQQIRNLTIGHTAPTHVSTPAILTNWSAQWSTSKEFGRSGAASYAQVNGASVASYSAGVSSITVDVDAHRTDVESPVGNRAVESLSAPATATAEVDYPEVGCSYRITLTDNNGNVLQWAVTCYGTNGGQATVDYYGPTTLANNLEANMDEWRKLFEIRLID